MVDPYHGEKILVTKGLFNLAEKRWNKNNGLMLKLDKFRLERRHNFLTLRVIGTNSHRKWWIPHFLEFSAQNGMRLWKKCFGQT